MHYFVFFNHSLPFAVAQGLLRHRVHGEKHYVSLKKPHSGCPNYFKLGQYGKPLMEKINELIFSIKASHIYLSDT